MTDQEVVDWIEDYLQVNHFAPSMREIGRALGLSSSNTVWQRLRKMRAAGLVEWNDRDPRTIRAVYAEAD